MSEETWRAKNSLKMCLVCKVYLPEYLFQREDSQLCLYCNGILVTGLLKRQLSKTETKDSYQSTVDHPSYYNKGKIEVIDFIEDQKLGFHLGNVVKYICREEKAKDKTRCTSDCALTKEEHDTLFIKERVEDLKKALWYLKRYIESYQERRGEKEKSIKAL